MEAFYEDFHYDFYIEKGDSLTFAPHLHKHIELYYICSGKMEAAVGGVRSALFPGDVSIVFPNEIHSYSVPKECKRIMLLFTPECVPDYIGLLTKYHPKNPVLRKRQVSPTVPHCLNALLREKDLIDLRLTRAYISVVLGCLFRELKLEKTEQGDDLSLPQRALIYINEHFCEQLSQDMAARCLGVSKSHLSRMFSQKIGVPFHSYLNRLRIDHAAKQLLTTDKTITQIAYDCGYDCLRSFNRVFRELLHMTPRQYRMQNFSAAQADKR